MKTEMRTEITSEDFTKMMNCLVAILERGFQIPPFAAVVVLERAADHIRKFHNIEKIESDFISNVKHD